MRTPVARALLWRLGRPDATRAEMWVIGRAFSCQRCSEHAPSSWNQIVKHFAEEQNHWTQAQPKLSAFPPASKPVFHNTHDLAHPSPGVKVLAPAASSDLKDLITARDAWPTKRNVYRSLGVEAEYSHHVLPGLRSNLIEHLISAHEVQGPIEGVHFKVVESDSSEGSLDGYSSIDDGDTGGEDGED
ncbi:hypothetical protein BDV93DRAFT_513419 [Ceratobasidium sp. AG-I]|nr:hypothetical protein BDV93DRAFT_513419 [Ceratobasidium sp. AG-I]